MKFIRRSRIQFFGRRRNEDVFEELKVDPIEKKLAQYKQNWFGNVSRMKTLHT
jgi:hypothetical protein